MNRSQRLINAAAAAVALTLTSGVSVDRGWGVGLTMALFLITLGSWIVLGVVVQSKHDGG